MDGHKDMSEDLCTPKHRGQSYEEEPENKTNKEWPLHGCRWVREKVPEGDGGLVNDADSQVRQGLRSHLITGITKRPHIWRASASPGCF